LRVLTGGYAVVHLRATAPSLLQIARLPASQLAPVGVLSWLPGPLPEAAVATGLALAVVTGVAFVLGAGWRVSGPLFAVLFFLLSNYRVSWGHVSHADHLPALRLLVCGLVPASLAALAVELGAPVALLGGRWRDAWVASAWLFHVGIAATMAIAFPYPLSLVAFAPFYAVEVPVIRAGKRLRPRRIEISW
jgi:hypothetical protein